MIFQPGLVRFGTECPYQTEATGGIGKDPHDPRAPFDFLVESLQHVGRLQVLVMLARQTVEVERLADIGLDPISELWIAGRPAREPRLQVLLGFFQVAPVVEPAQFLPTIVVRLAGQVVERIAKKCT